jgi:UDP-N-acetylmuramate--alanine ligase
LTFGKRKTNDIRLKKHSVFEIALSRQKSVPIKLKSNLVGEHNQFNLAAALAFFVGLNTVANKISATGNLELAPVALNKIVKSFAAFSGTERRMQFIGSRGCVRVYDDYAHHPAEIKSTLKAFKDNFHRHDLWVIFQPHTFTRTRAFLEDFAKSLGKADFIGLLPIYGSARENNATISSEAIAKFFSRKKCVSFSTHKDCLDFLNNYRFGKPTILVTMGAGDGWQVGRKLLKIK